MAELQPGLAHFWPGFCLSWDRRGRTMRRMIKLITFVVMVLSLLLGRVSSAQSSPDVDRRLTSLEGMRADVRLSALEARFEALDREQDRRVGRLENLVWTTLIGVAGQLLLSGASLRVRRVRGEENRDEN